MYEHFLGAKSIYFIIFVPCIGCFQFTALHWDISNSKNVQGIEMLIIKLKSCKDGFVI